MKVTDEMVRHALCAWGEARDGGIVEDWAPMRLSLEAALADVPEPAHQLDIAVELTDALTRANIAEAKLAKVREWASGRGFVTDAEDWRQLRAILNEEP